MISAGESNPRRIQPRYGTARRGSVQQGVQQVQQGGMSARSAVVQQRVSDRSSARSLDWKRFQEPASDGLQQTGARSTCMRILFDDSRDSSHCSDIWERENYVHRRLVILICKKKQNCMRKVGGGCESNSNCNADTFPQCDGVLILNFLHLL